jgi:hypothetical protein
MNPNERRKLPNGRRTVVDVQYSNQQHSKIIECPGGNPAKQLVDWLRDNTFNPADLDDLDWARRNGIKPHDIDWLRNNNPNADDVCEPTLRQVADLAGIPVPRKSLSSPQKHKVLDQAVNWVRDNKPKPRTLMIQLYEFWPTWLECRSHRIIFPCISSLSDSGRALPSNQSNRSLIFFILLMEFFKSSSGP